MERKMTLHKIMTGLLKARIAYHRRQANSYNKSVPRSFRRDHYQTWLHTRALHHSMKAHHLERKLLLATA